MGGNYTYSGDKSGLKDDAVFHTSSGMSVEVANLSAYCSSFSVFSQSKPPAHRKSRPDKVCPNSCKTVKESHSILSYLSGRLPT